MKPFLLSLAAGMLVGTIYALIGVKSPAPPTIALIGLLGIVLGEQAVPIARKLIRREPVLAFIQTDCAPRILGAHILEPRVLGHHVPGGPIKTGENA